MKMGLRRALSMPPRGRARDDVAHDLPNPAHRDGGPVQAETQPLTPGDPPDDLSSLDIGESTTAQRWTHPGEARISVVVPAMNEARNLRYVLPPLADIVEEVILVDGHSTDDTVAVARALLPDIKVVTQQGRGKGDALRSGFETATGDIVVMLDADGSADPHEIPTFVEALFSGADVAKGSRFLRDGKGGRAGSSDITLLRRLGNKALNGCVNVLFRTRFTDLCYGYNAFWSDCLQLFEVDCSGFEVETLISLRARKAQLTIVEVPSFELSRVHGTSNLHTFRDGWRVLKTILREYRNGQDVIITQRLPIMPRPSFGTPAHIASSARHAKKR